MQISKSDAGFVTCAIAYVLLAGPIWSQTISGEIAGNVFDASGAVIQNASVSASNVATGAKTTITSNSAGQYRLSNLPVGEYRMRTSLPGFAISTINGVLVGLNKTSTVHIALQPEGLSSSVTVSDAPQLLDTTTAQIQDTFTSKSILSIPLSNAGLGALNLALLSSGIAGNGGVGAGVGPSVGGQRPRNNNYTVEGTDNNNKASTGPSVYVPIDAVGEFTLLKNQFATEHGHSSGGQFNIIVNTGGNVFHGKLYEYLQNRKLNALDVAFSRQGVREVPRSDQNRIGAAAGGPIWRNKWFYFADFEYAPTGNANTPSGGMLTPTAEGYSTLASVPGLSATNMALFKRYVPASPISSTRISINDRPIAFGPLSVIAPSYQNGYAGVLSSDYQLSDRDQLRGRLVYNRNSFTDTAGVSLPSFYVGNTATYYLVAIAEQHAFSPTLLNEVRFGYNRQNQMYGGGSFTFPGLDAFPNLTFDDIGLQLGPNPQAPQGSVQNVYQVTDTLTWMRDKHTMTVGTDIRRHISPSVYTQRSRGDYEYSSLDLFLRDFTPDVTALRGLGNVRFYGDQIATYFHAQDSWRLNPNLTINIGLRYEYTTTPITTKLQALNGIASVPGVLEFAEPKPQKSAFAPRIGVAYSPGTSGKMSVRAGFGMAHDVLCDNISMLALPPQLGSMADVAGQGLAGFLAHGGIPVGTTDGVIWTPETARASTAFYIPIQTTLPYSLQWNLTFERVFARDYTFEVRYLGTRGVHLPLQQQINRTPRVTSGFDIPQYLNRPSPNVLASLPLTVGDIKSASNILPSFASAGFLNGITAWTPQGTSSYNGLSVELKRRFSAGLQLQSSYTWSHVLDNSTSEVGSTFLTPRRAQDPQNLRPEWASSMLDRRHRFTTMLIYMTPLHRRWNSFVRNAIGSWELAPTYIYESPEYFTAQSGIDSNLNGDSAGDRALINPNGAAHTASEVYGVTRAGKRVSISAENSELNQVVAWVAENPNARYVRAGLGVLPTGGRNTEPTRPINNVNLTASRRFHFSEKVYLQVAGQAFNLLNHAQFVPGLVNSINSVVTAYTPGVKNFVTAGHPAFGNVEAAFSSNPRVVQIFGKLVW
jgi:hypothetical protein